jgi:hypothetical protein
MSAEVADKTFTANNTVQPAPFSWELPLHAIPTTTLSMDGGFLRDLFSISWHTRHEGSEEMRHPLLDMSDAMRSMRAHVNQDLRASLRARAMGIKSLQILEDTNVLLVFLKSPINDDNKVILKVRLLPTPDWPFSPAYIEAAVQLALQTLNPFCPHFALMSFSLRGGGVVVPGWPLNKVVPPTQGALNGLDVDVSLDDAGEGSSDLGDNLPVFFVVEEFLDESLDIWFEEALEFISRHPHDPNLPTALTHAACCLFQIVYALFSAQRWFSFQHNDLHHKNVRLKHEKNSLGETSCETWEYSVPLLSEEEGEDTADSKVLRFRLPGHIVRGRRVKIFDFGLSTLKGVRTLDQSALPQRVSSFFPIATPPVAYDTATNPSQAASSKPLPVQEEDDVESDVTPDVVVDDGVQLFPLGTENIRWFAKREMAVNSAVRARAVTAIRTHSLLPLPLEVDSDDTALIPDLPLDRSVPGYDMAVWVRHMLCHSQGFCGLVAAMQQEALRDGPCLRCVWAREFVSWICQAGALEPTTLQFIDGQWSRKDKSTVRGPRFYVSPTATPLVHFLRPMRKEQLHTPLSSPDAMLELLRHGFFRRWLDPPAQPTYSFHAPDPSMQYTARMTSIHAPTEQERQEIQNRLRRTRSRSL